MWFLPSSTHPEKIDSITALSILKHQKMITGFDGFSKHRDYVFILSIWKHEDHTRGPINSINNQTTYFSVVWAGRTWPWLIGSCCLVSPDHICFLSCLQQSRDQTLSGFCSLTIAPVQTTSDSIATAIPRAMVWLFYFRPSGRTLPSLGKRLPMDWYFNGPSCH